MVSFDGVGFPPDFDSILLTCNTLLQFNKSPKLNLFSHINTLIQEVVYFFHCEMGVIHIFYCSSIEKRCTIS